MPIISYMPHANCPPPEIVSYLQLWTLFEQLVVEPLAQEAAAVGDGYPPPARRNYIQERIDKSMHKFYADAANVAQAGLSAATPGPSVCPDCATICIGCINCLYLYLLYYLFIFVFVVVYLPRFFLITS